MGKNKGKAVQGRAKQKQKAQKGNNQAGLWSGKSPKQNRIIHDYDDEDDETFQSFRGFTQSKMDVNFTPRSFNTSLRHQGIAFVSAGVNPSSIDRPPKTSQEVATEAVGVLKEEDQNQETDSDIDDLDEDMDDSAIQTNIILDDDLKFSENGIANMNIETSPASTHILAEGSGAITSMQSRPNEASTSEALPFVVDTVGDPNLSSGFKPEERQSTRRAPSPTPSDSCEEVVVFHGRNAAAIKARTIEDPVGQVSRQKASTAPPVGQSPQMTDDLLRALEKASEAGNPTPTPPSRQKYVAGDHPLPNEWTPAPSEPYWRKNRGKDRRKVALSSAELMQTNIHPHSKPKNGLADPLAAENSNAENAIATLQADWKNVLRAKKSARDNDAKSKPSKRRGRRGRKKSNRDLANANFSDDDDDLDGEAAYDDYMANLAAQMDAEDEEKDGNDAFTKDTAHSFALGGPSMVVDGKEYGEDEVLPQHLKDEATVDEGDDDEWESESGTSSQLNPDSDELSVELSLDESDLEDELEYSERQQWEDEADLRQRRVDGMTDEHLARLFAKQQEMGYDGDDLIIDDGADMTMDGVGDIAAARAGLEDFMRLSVSGGKKQDGKRSRRKKDDVSFPDASAFADALDQYGENGFDVMDFDRPSLRPTKKGRKGKLPPEIDMLSDDELREDLNEAWEHDRQKKRQKKLEREELRVQGLLGSGGKRDKADLNVRYAQGMTMKQVYAELKEFLLDADLAERAFPPMDKRDRKALHEIAVALQLTSKSRGAGKNRFPVLYKTSRTVEYSDDLFRRIVEASSRGFLTNRGKATKFAKNAIKESRRKGRGGFDKSAVTLQNGELVGAGAAEIGRENFGHRLMEKMGWTKGQALGKDGAGLLVPVEQRMRVGTAGLG